MGVCLARFVLRFCLVCVISGWVCLFRADFLAVLRVGVGCDCLVGVCGFVGCVCGLVSVWGCCVMVGLLRWLGFRVLDLFVFCLGIYVLVLIVAFDMVNVAFLAFCCIG